MHRHSHAARHLARQTLLIDADDTLWENNIYFERAIASFISYLDHRLYNPEQVRERLNSVERATISARGYGLRSFRQSLVTCFEQLTDHPITPEKHDRIVSFAQSIADQEIELLPHVAETLSELATRHRLILVTKGDPLEQTDKLRRSGLAPHFSAVEVLPDRHLVLKCVGPLQGEELARPKTHVRSEHDHCPEGRAKLAMNSQRRFRQRLELALGQRR